MEAPCFHESTMEIPCVHGSIMDSPCFHGITMGGHSRTSMVHPWDFTELPGRFHYASTVIPWRPDGLRCSVILRWAPMARLWWFMMCLGTPVVLPWCFHVGFMVLPW